MDKPAPAQSATDSFKAGGLSSLWKRFAPRTALAFSLFTAGCAGDHKINPPQVDDDKPADVNNGSNNADPPPEIVALEEALIFSPKEEQRRDRINQALMQAAQKQYPALLQGGGNGYAQDLLSLQSRLTAYLKRGDHSLHDRVVILDPAKFDVGMALGFQVPQAVRLMLRGQNIKPSPDLVSDIAAQLDAPYVFRFGAPGFTQNPHAMMNIKPTGADACVIIPSSDHALQVDIKGLRPGEEVVFANRHEGWHCLDAAFTLRDIDQAKVKAVLAGKLDAQVDDPVAMEIYANNYRKESLADIGAIGDMIRQDGYGLDLADKISAWRKRYPTDVMHLSAPVIAGFKAKVEAMGLPAFRALTDDQARDLYIGTTVHFGMSAKSLAAGVRLEMADFGEQIRFGQAAKTDPDIAKAIDFLAYYYHKHDEPGAGPLTPSEQQVFRQLRQWNAVQTLEDKAVALGGKITPVTMVQAYGALQENFHLQLQSQPGNVLLAAQMTKLQQSFIYHVQNCDYVDRNSRRGIDLTAVEPLVKGMAAKPAVAKSRTPT